MPLTFKPKKQQIHVPGHGVVQKQDFTKEHFDILMLRAGDNRSDFLKQYFVVDSYGDQPLFEDAPEPQPLTKKGGKKSKAPVQELEPEPLSDEDQPNELIAEEEKNKKGIASE